MSQEEVMYLVGDFSPQAIDRWSQFATVYGMSVVQCSLDDLCRLKNCNPVIIMDEYGLNEAPFPPTQKD